ncbi:hypothetical protein TSAR_002988, partial [Trichomalopsis sarcophagae]
KLNKLDSIEKLQNTIINGAEENGCFLGERMPAIERSLEPLDKIPRLMNWVTVVEADMAVLRAEQVHIKAKLEQLIAKGAGPSTDSCSVSAFDLETVRQLRDSSARIQAQLDRVASSQAKLSAELLTERDSTSARPLIKRRAVREDDAGSASTAVAVTKMRPTPSAVTVSRTLMRSLISAKIKIKKLHTKQLSADLLRDARITLPLLDSFININEYLPPDVHRLGVATRPAARGIGCTTFMRDGRIYIRAKNEARAVMVTSDEELKNFLDSHTN